MLRKRKSLFKKFYADQTFERTHGNPKRCPTARKIQKKVNKVKNSWPRDLRRWRQSEGLLPGFESRPRRYFSFSTFFRKFSEMTYSGVILGEESEFEV